MKLTDRILASILAAMVVWVVTRIATYYVQRSRLKSAILTDLLLHQRGIKLQGRAIKAMFDNDVLKEGSAIPFPIQYANEEWLLYRSLQRDLSVYLSRETLRKIVKFYHHMWELDHSMMGFAKALEHWESNERILSKADMDHLKKRVARIESMAYLISDARITRLSDLPDDYRESMGMDAVLQRPSEQAG